MKMVVMQVGMLGVNCYIVVSDSQNAAVIDPGGEAERILDYLQANKLTLQKILLTHGHIDHIGAVKALKERTGAEIYIHASDAEMLSDPVKNLASPFRMAYQPVSPDHTFSDGSQISLDEITFTVMHTPGHTKGSSVFLTGTTMLSGDTLFQGSIGRIDFYGGAGLRRILCSCLHRTRWYIGLHICCACAHHQRGRHQAARECAAYDFLELNHNCPST